jgi:hypothetical protein
MSESMKMTDAELERLVLIGESHVATLPAVVGVQVGAEVFELARECLAARKRAALDAQLTELTYESSLLILCAHSEHCEIDGRVWCRPDGVRFDLSSRKVQAALNYLHLRGLLECTLRYGWVRVRDESEATA